MSKKHLHHFSRGLVIGFEALGLIALVIFTAWLFLVIRLSQGPLNVDFLTHHIEKSLNGQQGFEFSVDTTVLTWGGAGQPFQFEMSGVQIRRTDKTPVLSVQKIGVQLSKRHLAFGRFVPRVIRIYAPALRIVRNEDGHFTLNVSETAAVPDITEAVIDKVPEVAPPENQAATQADFITGLLAQLKDTERSTLLGGLDRVSITDAALLYEDKILQVGWKSKKSDVIFTRGKSGMLIDSVANVELDPTHTAYLRGSFYYSWQTHRANGVAYFTSFNPSLMAQKSERLKDYAGIDLPLKGSVALEMDADFKLDRGRFMLGSGPGKFNAFGLYAEPLPVTKFYMQGQFNAGTREALLEDFRADLGGPVITAKGAVRREEEGHVIAANAVLENMPMDNLKSYWPETLTSDPRAWVTGHLSEGTAAKATLDLEMFAPLGDFNALQLQKLGGQIDFNGIKVDYFPPLMPVTKVAGKAVYDQKSFNLDISTGALGDMKVTGSKIAITGLDVQNETIHSQIDIDVTLEGPLRTALKVLDSEPLRYPQDLGIKTAEVAGAASVDVNFKFPLYHDLTVEEVKVAAKAKLDNVLLKDIVAGLPLSGGPMTLTVDNGAMTVKGKGLLGTMPVEFDWLRNFSGSKDISSRIVASLPLDAPALIAFGVPPDLKMEGIIPADVTYTATTAGLETLLFKGDITPAAFTLPVVDYQKMTGIPGSLGLILHFKNDLPAEITSFNLLTGEAQMKGNIAFAADGKTLKKADFEQIRLGDTEIALSADSDGKGYNVKITGRQFDASKLLAGDDKPNSDAEAAIPVPPLTVSMKVDRLVTGKNKHIDKIDMLMRRNMWSRIEQLEVTGISGNKPVELRYLPLAKGHSLRLEAGNAGATLSALGITHGVRGGKIAVHGNPNPAGGPRDLKGIVSLTDFTLVDVPILARLLNALSLNGIVDLLNGKGIAFKRMRADFWWIDKGQPENPKNTRIIKIKDGQTSGASLGLTFEGNIDNWTNMLDISGTIIPVSDLNKILKIIPLVGDILTGGGEGIFAATYTIKGPKDQPTVTVNPLSVLAPGILRKLFFEK